MNETFQKRFFPHGSPLGRHIGTGDSGPTDWEIVGVVKDSKEATLKERSKPWAYTAARQDEHPSALTFYLRTSGDPLAAAQTVRRIANRIDATLPIFDLKTLTRQTDETHFLDRLLAWLSLAFGLPATLIASVGLATGIPAPPGVGALRPERTLIKANDATVIASVVATIVAVSVLAAYIPARRAAWIEPMSALHHD